MRSRGKRRCALAEHEKGRNRGHGKDAGITMPSLMNPSSAVVSTQPTVVISRNCFLLAR